MKPVTIDELRNVVALSELPDEHLQWILDHSEQHEKSDGEQVIKTGEPVDNMMIVIEGSSSFYMDINGQQVYFYSFENNKETGGIGGLMPYSRMTHSPGNAYANGKLRFLYLHKKYFGELEQLNNGFIQRLVAYMTDRARTFATLKLQQEKVSALGKLSAGIAHELNNPAAAINRISSELNERLQLNFELTKKMLTHCVSAADFESIHALVRQKNNGAADLVKMSAMKRMQFEDEMADWFADHNISKSAELCETFIAVGITIDDLEEILKISGEKSFIDVVAWFENIVSSKRLIDDLEHASGRISKLVGAIKSHVHMDRTNDVQRTNIVADIENTLILLGHKLREKNISIERNYAPNLPETDAFVGELNQVWMNVIDNAIYALPKNGKINIEIFTKNSDLKVNIIDNGEGIPANILPRIFDPFFSTKKVGQGTGIGLDIVSRIIQHHKGEIKVNSQPGHTEFNICLPLNHVKAEK
jgi:signal transduction histidine kinase